MAREKKVGEGGGRRGWEKGKERGCIEAYFERP